MDTVLSFVSFVETWRTSRKSHLKSTRDQGIREASLFQLKDTDENKKGIF